MMFLKLMNEHNFMQLFAPAFCACSLFQHALNGSDLNIWTRRQFICSREWQRQTVTYTYTRMDYWTGLPGTGPGVQRVRGVTEKDWPVYLYLSCIKRSIFTLSYCYFDSRISVLLPPLQTHIYSQCMHAFGLWEEKRRPWKHCNVTENQTRHHCIPAPSSSPDLNLLSPVNCTVIHSKVVCSSPAHFYSHPAGWTMHSHCCNIYVLCGLSHVCK